MDGTRMVRILGNEIPVVGPPRPPLPTVAVRFPARLLDSRRRQDRALRRREIANFERSRAVNASVLNDALLVLGAQALEVQQSDADGARLVALVHQDRAAVTDAARANAELAQLGESRARIISEQVQLTNSPAVDAAARRLHLAQQLATLDAAIAARMTTTQAGGKEQQLTRDLGRYALASGTIVGVNVGTIAQAQDSYLKVTEADAAIEGYQSDLATLDAVAPPSADLVALIGIVVSLIIALGDISSGFVLGSMACGAIGAAAAPFLIAPSSRHSALLRAACWILAMVGLSSASGLVLDAGRFPVGSMIGVGAVSLVVVGGVALMRRRGAVASGLGVIAFLLATTAVEGNIVWTHFRLAAQARAEQAAAQAQHVALLRHAVELFCAGKVDGELVGLEPLLADVPWAEFDKTSEAKLRALVAQRPKLLKVAEALRLQADAVSKQGDARSDADRLEGGKTEEQCTSTIKFWNESFNMRFFVVANEGGGTFTIRTDSGEGHLLTGLAGRWTTTGWADARVSNPSANMFVEVPPASQADALACQQAFAKRNQNKATMGQAEQQLRSADQQLRAELDSIGQGFAATCREIDTPAKLAKVDAPRPSTDPTPLPAVTPDAGVIDARVAALTATDVERLINAQAASLTTAATAFIDSFADSSIAFFPHALAPFEGHDKIIDGLRQAWGERGAIGDVTTSLVNVGVAGSVAWAATTWTLTRIDTKIVMPVRVTEVLIQGPAGLHVVAASFSVAPAVGAPGITGPIPALAGGIPARDGPAAWLATPVELSKRLLDDAMDASKKDAMSLFGSDLAEKAIGVDAVRRLLVAWKWIKIEIVGNVRVIDGDDYKVVLEFVRSAGPKPTVFRVLGVFVRGTGMVGPAPWQLASAQYSVAVPEAAQTAGAATAPTPGSTCTIAALNCNQFSTHGQTGKKLHALVFAAEQAGRHAEAICLARSNLTSGDKWLAGAANFDSSRAWGGLGCREQAVAAIEVSLAVRPRDQGGWKETCEQCQKIGGTCAPCNEATLPGAAAKADTVDEQKGFLTITSKPAAKILVDGVDSGLTTPIGGKQLPLSPGNHKITFLVGDEKRTYAIVIQAGETQPLNQDLLPDCATTLVDLKSEECRTQFCDGHKDDTRCGME